MGKYKEFLKNELTEQQYNKFNSIFNNYQIKTLQTLLNVRGENLTEDGVLGFNTMMALINHIEVLDELFDDMVKVVSPISNKEKAMLEIQDFLQINEGITCHYLKNEHGFTTPYGVYSVANPNSKAVLFVKRLYLKHGLNEHRRLDAYKLDKLITNAERQKIKDFAIELYINKYMGKMFDVLINYRKSLLTYFSNSVNAGKPRASKILQGSIGAKVDGKIGKGSLSKLQTFLHNYGDDELSNSMLSKMASFYCILVTKRRSRFGRFKNGWFNRLKHLGYKAKRLCVR